MNCGRPLGGQFASLRCSPASAPGGLPRPCVVVRVAAPAPASTPATAAADDEGSRYLQRIPGLPELELLRGPAEAPIETSTSGRTGGQLLGPAEQRAVLARRNLAVNGHYMLQVRILGNIFSRARNSSTQSGTPSSPPTGQAKLAAGSSAAKKHVGAAAKPKTAVKRPSRAQDTRPARARLQPGRQQEAGKAGRRSFVQACEDAAASGVANTPRVASAFSSVPALQKRVAEGMPIVEDILNAMAGISSTPLSTLLPGVNPMVAHQALLALGSRGLHRDVQKLVQAMEAAGCVNEHTHACAMAALDRAGHFDLALSHFEDLQRRGLNVGPVCASMIIKLCVQRRNLRLAMDVFHRLHGHTTLNRFTYNCLIHLCAILGNVDEAVHVLSMMREDDSVDTLPDGFSYAELLKAVVSSKRWQLLPKVYREMQRAQVRLSPEHWTLMITAAGRAGDPELAYELYRSAKQQYRDALHIDNALLSSVCRHAPLTEMLAVYRSILADGLHPDQYTFNAILTTMCKFGTSLYAVDDLLGEMYKWGVKINVYTGTSLISAYRRAPELNSNDPRMTTLLLEKVHDILSQLVAQRQANSRTFGLVMAMHAELGDTAGVYRVLQQMRDAAVQMDGRTCMAVSKGFEDGGFFEAAQQFLQHTRHVRAPQPKRSGRRTRW